MEKEYKYIKIKNFKMENNTSHVKRWQNEDKSHGQNLARIKGVLDNWQEKRPLIENWLKVWVSSLWFLVKSSA